MSGAHWVKRGSVFKERNRLLLFITSRKRTQKYAGGVAWNPMYTVFWSFWEYFWISGEFPATPKGFRSSVKPDWCSKTIPFPCLWALILVILAPILVMLFSKKWNVIRGGSLILKIMMIFILYEDWLQKIYTVWRLLPRDTTKPLRQLLQSRMSRHAYIYTAWRMPPSDPTKLLQQMLQSCISRHAYI